MTNMNWHDGEALILVHRGVVSRKEIYRGNREAL